MKKKIILIVIIATITTIIIYNIFKTEKISFLALGDGVASGMTNYNIEGYSFNDYLRDYLKEQEMLESYIRDFVKKGSRVEDVVTALESNSEIEIKNTKITIMQAIANSNLITIAVGTDELVANTGLTSDAELINSISAQMKLLIEKIRSFSSKKIIIVGLYYSPLYENSVVDKINDNYQIIANNNECIFLDSKEKLMSSSYFLSEKTHYINYKGHEVISAQIISAINM